MHMNLPKSRVVWRPFSRNLKDDGFTAWLTIRVPGQEDLNAPVPVTESDLATVKRKLINPEWATPPDYSPATPEDVIRKLLDLVGSRLSQAFMVLDEQVGKHPTGSKQGPV